MMSEHCIRWDNPRLVGRIPELDGVRGLAILLVLVWHYIANILEVIAPHTWQSNVVTVLGVTWSGVDLFFVLSGFLIGGILYDAKSSTNYYRTFYFRRMFRIFPLYFIWVALFLVGLYFMEAGGNHGAIPFEKAFNRIVPVWTYPLFLQNFSMAEKDTFGTVWLGITWSLAVEEQFYLLLPLLIRRLSYRGIAYLALASVVAAPIIRLLLWWGGYNQTARYVLLPCRADALGLGVLVALACRNKEVWEWIVAHRGYLNPAFLVLGCGFALLHEFQKGLSVFGYSWIAAFYAVLLLRVLVRPESIETRFFRSWVLVTLGTLAYAVYLFHQGVIVLFHFAIFGKMPVLNDWLSLSVSVVSLIIVMLLATLSWRLFEKPLIRHAHTTYRY